MLWYDNPSQCLLARGRSWITYGEADLCNRVEQPVGTGYSIGDITATSEEEIAQDFIHFFKNFEKAFGIKNFKIYVTGQSYAGRYVPYISAAMLDQKDKTYYDLSGKSQ
jgi:carboxypeptidase D